ncbi:MAG: hypothetical protein ACJA2N_000766 [Salibacteraceae bacterium]|jgi:hypothetical protein
MLHFIDRHKFGLLGTVLLHFLVILLANYTVLPEGIVDKELVIHLNMETIELRSEDHENENQTVKPSNDNSNKGVNEAGPKEVKSGEYNEFDKEPSETSKQNFEQQLANELKALEDQVIKDQRDAGYGYSQEEIDAMLNAKKNSELDQVKEQEPRSESAFKGNTNITYKLSNRFDTRLNVPVYMCQYGGVVVINIAVNQEGKVLSVKLDEESSKTNDACLIDAALKSAKRTRFNRKKSASKVQLGSITYKFIEQ